VAIVCSTRFVWTLAPLIALMLTMTACRGVGANAARDAGTSGAAVHTKPVLPGAFTPSEPAIPSRVVELVAGRNHVCARLAIGRVLCWGRNQLGQVGDGTRISRATPTDTGIVDAVALDAGPYSTCAVHADGGLSCWGATRPYEFHLRPPDADYVRLAPQNYLSPVRLDASDVIDVSVVDDGSFYTLSSEGEVRRFENPSVATGRSYFSFQGHAVASVPGGVELAAAEGGLCVRLESGVVQCPVDDSTSTVSVHATQLEASFNFICALTPEREVWCWPADGSAPPQHIDGVSEATGLAALASEICALRSDGPPLCWSWFPPEPLESLEAAQSPTLLAGSGARRYDFACVVDAEGALSCFGQNDFGELGNGDRGIRPEAVRVPGVHDAVQIALNQTQSCARRASGTVVCWGGIFDGDDVPHGVEGVDDATLLAAGGETGACVLSPSLGLYCWGDVAFLESGLGNRGEAVPLPPDLTLADVSLGGPWMQDSVWVWADVVDVEGRVFNIWPYTGTRQDERWPEPVTHVAYRDDFGDGPAGCGLQTNGRVHCFADRYSGLYGLGELPIDGVVSLSVGHSAICMVRETGDVICIGDNSHGALGIGEVGGERWAAPFEPVVGLTDAVQVATTAQYACAVRATGAVACWGFNEFGASGRAAAGTDPLLRDVVGVSTAVEVAVAPERACARLRSGEVACWGWDHRNRLGRGGEWRYPEPQRVEH